MCYIGVLGPLGRRERSELRRRTPGIPQSALFLRAALQGINDQRLPHLVPPPAPALRLALAAGH
jgi:hypothetical protein